jgi:hypothetical protein
MDEELISKKDLLKETGISYGQLYRWKRKSVIPEEWFIKKSTFTGQETFFPKQKILERIARIKDMKDELSLDDLAEKFSPQPSEIRMAEEELIKRNIVTMSTFNIYESVRAKKERYDFDTILFLCIVEKFLISGEVSFEEAKGILTNLEGNYSKFRGRDCEIIFIRKFGIGICILLPLTEEVYLEDTAKLVLKVNIGKFIEELKIKLV